MFMVTADYTLTDTTLEGKAFKTSREAWVQVAIDLALTDAGFEDGQRSSMVAAALAFSNETGMLEMSDGCHVEVVPVEVHSVVSVNAETYLLREIGVESGDTVYWIPSSQLWMTRHGEELAVDDLTLERIVD